MPARAVESTLRPVADRAAEPGADNSPRPDRRKITRLPGLQAWDWGRRFASRLKANAGWTRKFLHKDK